MNLKSIPWLILCFICFSSCDKDEKENVFDEVFEPGKEIALDVDMIKTDSGRIEFRIITPRREMYQEEGKLVESYPNGLHIDFYNDQEEVISSVDARQAIRVNKDGIMTLRDSVVLVNKDGDKLITPGIVWDKVNHTLNTSKFVKLIRVATQDTSTGFGFYAQDDFSVFQINNFRGKRRYQDLSKEITED